MSVIEEFKKFAMKGNVIDLAIGVVIGGAFGKITTSLVNDIIMPPLGMLLGNVDFSELKLVLKEGASAAETVSINYGAFINTAVNFLIIAWAMFIVVKAINKLNEKKESAPEPEKTAPTPEDIVLLREIRDALKK